MFTRTCQRLLHGHSSATRPKDDEVKAETHTPVEKAEKVKKNDKWDNMQVDFLNKVLLLLSIQPSDDGSVALTAVHRVAEWRRSKLGLWFFLVLHVCHRPRRF